MEDQRIGISHYANYLVYIVWLQNIHTVLLFSNMLHTEEIYMYSSSVWWFFRVHTAAHATSQYLTQLVYVWRMAHSYTFRDTPFIIWYNWLLASSGRYTLSRHLINHFHWRGFKAWISNYIHNFIWDVITHSCHNTPAVSVLWCWCCHISHLMSCLN